MKLNDTYLVLLATAAKRDNKSVYPLPTTLSGSAVSVTKAVAKLIDERLLEERATNDKTAIRHQDDDGRYGLFITDAGLSAIDCGPSAADDEPDLPSGAGEGLAPGSKLAGVLDLLRRQDGATMAELTIATGWLPHSTRAALTGLRKKGHSIARDKRDGTTCYHIAEVRQ